MTYEGMFDEIECKYELKRQKKYIEKKNNEIIIIKGKLKDQK